MKREVHRKPNYGMRIDTCQHRIKGKKRETAYIFLAGGAAMIDEYR